VTVIAKRKYAYLFAITSLVLLLSLVGLTGCPTPGKFTLTTNVSPPGAGSVSPPGGDYDSGMSVTLTATPASGYTFDYWGGSATGTNTTTTVIMNSDKSVTANFEEAGPTALFSDDFSHDTGVWDIFSDANGEVFYENGWLHVINYTDAPVYTYSIAYQYFADLILEVETKLVDGTDDNWHAVQCRWQDNDNFYVFGVSADGYYLIGKAVDGNGIDLVEPTYSSYINQGVGAVNLIHVECIGNSLSISVNGHLLTSVTDSTFSSGDIGLAATSLAGSFTEIAFDNLVVTEP